MLRLPTLAARFNAVSPDMSGALTISAMNLARLIDFIAGSIGASGAFWKEFCWLFGALP